MYSMRNKSKRQQTADASKYPQGYFKPKKCKKCQQEFTPNAPSEMYCCDECKDYGVQSAYLLRNYGITLDQYNEMLESQGHKCKICGGEGFLMNSHKHKVKLVVDHDHKTGEVRGLLCHNCNRAIGLLQESLDNVISLKVYLERATTIPKGSTSQANGGGNGKAV